jgi:hypothetical protein
MSLKITYVVNISYEGDGLGPLGNTPNGPSVQFTGQQLVLGGATPTGAQITTACTAMGTDISNQANVAAVLARLQALETGGT